MKTEGKDPDFKVYNKLMWICYVKDLTDQEVNFIRSITDEEYNKIEEIKRWGTKGDRDEI